MFRHRVVFVYIFAALAALCLAQVSAWAQEFNPPMSYAAGSSPHGVAIGDFNGDGIPDLAVVNFGSNNVSILLGNGNGTFQAAVDYKVGTGPYYAAVGDFTGSGVLDLAVANSNNLTGTGSISVLLGNGDGTFQTAVNYNSVGAPVYVCAADLNGDGYLDLAAANHGGGVTIFLNTGNGTGTFDAAVSYTAGSNPGSVAIGDFNGDGIPDIAAANKDTNNVSILLGKGEGTFQNPVNYAAGINPATVGVGDFTGNGILDLAVTNNGGTGSNSTVSVLLGNGNGTFQTQTTLAAGSGPSGLVVVDVNGDGIPDLVITNQGNTSNNVEVYLGTGNGNPPFQTGVTYAAGSNPRIVAAADLNGGGAPDLAVADAGTGGDVDVLLNTGGTFVTTTSSANPSNLGQTVTFTTTVMAAVNGTGTPTGTVTFECGTTVLGTSTLLAGVATLSTSTLTQGAHIINAIYSGNTTFNPNTAPPFTQTVEALPIVSLSPTSLSFGVRLVGTTSVAMNVTLTNTGSGSLSITSIGTTGDFAQTNTCGSSVAAGASCTISVTFTPTVEGSRMGTVSVTDNATGSPQTVTLSGIGTVVELSPTNLNFGNQKVGTTSKAKTITLTNTGASTLTITLISITGTNAGDFAQTNTCGSSVKAGATCTISVTFTPSATGPRTGTLNVADNGGGSPQKATLLGTGM